MRWCAGVAATSSWSTPSQDQDYGFEELGNAVRKIAIDLGVTIRFHGLDKLKKRPKERIVGASHPYHAIGEIDYPAADGSATGDFGVILYIKAGYHGVEVPGIRAYAPPTRPSRTKARLTSGSANPGSRAIVRSALKLPMASSMM
jgi:hypothetical protein